MKYVGLVKWYDETRGFGKIGCPNLGEVFFRISNFKKRPEKVSQALPLIFCLKTEEKGPVAIDIEVPASYEDFLLILSHLKTDPSISIEITVTGKSKWGNPYREKVIKHHNLIVYSTYYLFKGRKANDILEYFKCYFDSCFKGVASSEILDLFTITKKVVKTLKIELEGDWLSRFNQSEETKYNNSSNKPTVVRPRRGRPHCEFLLQEIYWYYLNNIDQALLFGVWKNRLYLVDANAATYGSSSFFTFPREIFINNYSLIDYKDLIWIINHLADGQLTAKEIISLKIEEAKYSVLTLKDILYTFRQVPNDIFKNQLKELISKEMLDSLLAIDFVEKGEAAMSSFLLALEIIKDQYNNIDYNQFINDFNDNIPDEVKFMLWQKSHYYEIEDEIIRKNADKLSYVDFISASLSFHQHYFKECLEQFTEIKSLESFGLLTFLIVETPVKAIPEIFNSLSLEYQIAYWLSFPKRDGYLWKYFECKYESSDINFTKAAYVQFISESSSLENLLCANSLVKEIQQLYYTKTSSFQKEGLRKISLGERIQFIQKCLSSTNSSQEELHKLLRSSVTLLEGDLAIAFIKAFIPKYINEDNLGFDNLVSLATSLSIKEPNKQEAFSYLGSLTSKLNRVKIWLKDYIHKIEFDEAIEVFDQFGLDEQPQLFRKLFSLVHKSRQNKSAYASSILSLSEKDNINLNIKICIAVLNELKANASYIDENIISETISKTIKDQVSGFIQIDDFFQECTGRTWMVRGGDIESQWCLNVLGKDFLVSGNTVIINGGYYLFNKETRTVDIEGEQVPFKWVKKSENIISRTYEKPTGVTYCDAVNSVFDDSVQKNFYWCCNNKCYLPNQSDNIYIEWCNYSLRDFIKILQMPFYDDKYYRLVSTINRANRLLKKLNCKSCMQLLRDVQTSEFAFYRVTTFHCTNSNCKDFHKPVYLNHCLNWRCNNVVDSRVSAKCPNDWYICDSCSNCCSQEKLKRRFDNLVTNNAFNPTNPRHQRLKFQVDNQLGHLERNEIYDFKTGENKA